MFEEKSKVEKASVAPESTRLDILSDQEFSFQPYKKPAQKKPPSAPARLNYPAKKPSPKTSPKAAPKRPVYAKRPSAKKPTWFGKKAGYKGKSSGGRMNGYYAAIQRRRQQAKLAAQKRAQAAKLARRKEIAAKLAQKNARTQRTKRNRATRR